MNTINMLEKFDGDFTKNIIQAATTGSPKIEVDDEDKFMEKIINLYTQLSTQLNFMNPFDVQEVRADYCVTDGKINMCDVHYKIKGKVLETTHKLVDFDMIINDSIIKVMIERFNSFIKELQNPESNLYKENIIRTKKSILFLLKQAKIKYSQRLFRFELSDERAADKSYFIDIVNKYKFMHNDSKDVVKGRLKINKPNTIREEDFKKMLLKAIRKMNLLMK